MHEDKPFYRMPGVVYQDREALDRYIAAGLLADQTIPDAFRGIAHRFPDRVALSEGDLLMTYRELDELTDRAGAAFLALGMRPLDRVIFQVANSMELVIAFLACLKAGLIPICALAAHRRLEISYLGRHAAAVAHFVLGGDPKFDFIRFSEELRAEVPSLRHTISVRGQVPAGSGAHALSDLIEHQDLESARRSLRGLALDPFQVALFQLSGGTTGVPKIIPRFHNEYLHTVRCVVDFHGLDEAIVAFTPNPMLHNAPMLCTWFPALFNGGEVAICASLDPATLGPFLAWRRPNWLLVTTTVIVRLQESGWLERLDFSTARGFSVINSPAKFSRMVHGAPTYSMFGMTEGLLCYCNDADPKDARDETVGRVMCDHDEIKLLEPFSERAVPEGEVGELATRGPSTIRGYYDAADRDAAAFTSDGFYRSGDLLRFRTIDGRRYLVFEGRIKDVVDRGGEKINCEEVERVCVAHAAIAAIAVVPMPDPIYGQRACAFVIAAPGAVAPTVGQLGEFLLREGLAKFKWPERIEVVEEFPLTSSGKLSKPKLRDMIEAALRADAEDGAAVHRAPSPSPV